MELNNTKKYLMSKQIHGLLLLLSILAFGVSKGQNTKVDSLENLLKIHQSGDTVEVNLLNKIAYVISNTDADKSRNYATQADELSDKLKFQIGNVESTLLIGLSYTKSDKAKTFDYLQKALKIAEEINYKTGIIKCLNSIGVAYKTRGEIPKAIECFEKGIKIAQEQNEILEMSKCSMNLAQLYFSENKMEKAVEEYQKALKHFEELNEKSLMSNCLNSLGVIYSIQGNYPLALECLQRKLKISEDQNDKSAVITGLMNIGSTYSAQTDYSKALEYQEKALNNAKEIDSKNQISACYSNIGNIYLKTKNTKALEYLQKALEISEKGSDETLTISIIFNIGLFYLDQADYEKAMVYYSKALEQAEKAGMKLTVCSTLKNIGTVYLRKKNYATALSYTLKSLDLANDLKLLSNQSSIHQQLSEIYAATNDYRNAYIHHQQYTQINDIVHNEKNTKKIAELEYRYKFEKEKQAIELDQQKKVAVQAAEKKLNWIIIFSLLAGFILMCLIAVFLFRSYRFKHKTNLVLTRQKHEIEVLNEEYLAINEEFKITNEELIVTKNLVEKSEEKLRLLIKNSNDILVLVNEKGEQFFISDAAKKLTGYHVEELLGSVKDVIYPDDLEIVQKHWERILADKDVADSIQYRHKHKEKGYVWFESVAHNFLDHPAIKSVVANVRDISERKKAEQAMLESEGEKARLMKMEMEIMGRELESNQKSVTSATLKLIQNSKRDTQTIERLMEIEESTNPTGKHKINMLISDYKRISYNSNWEEFELLFEKVHSSFYEKLNSQFPTLTANERKICAFLKLNMSSKEIAQITFQSDEALKKARLRLRQKLEINRETNLVTYLQNI
jgi:PAS domain S-box-containing protein